jgi:hypothetical protein
MVVLLKPRVVYDSKVTVKWEIELDRPTLFEKTILKRDGVKVFETTNIDIKEYTDREISEGEASYVLEVHLLVIGEDGNKIDFTNSADYTYDSALLEVADGVVKFKSLVASTETTLAAAMIFGSEVEVSGDRLQLKEVI